MTETLTLDDAGRLVLSEQALRLMGLRPGESRRANVTAQGIEILESAGTESDVPEIAVTRLENGILVVAPTGIPADIPTAIRACRDELAGRAILRE